MLNVIFNDPMSGYFACGIIFIMVLAAMAYLEKRNADYRDMLSRQCQTEYFDIKVDINDAYKPEQLADIPNRIDALLRKYPKVAAVSNYCESLTVVVNKKRDEWRKKSQQST